MISAVYDGDGVVVFVCDAALFGVIGVIMAGGCGASCRRTHAYGPRRVNDRDRQAWCGSAKTIPLTAGNVLKARDSRVSATQCGVIQDAHSRVRMISVNRGDNVVAVSHAPRASPGRSIPHTCERNRESAPT